MPLECSAMVYTIIFRCRCKASIFIPSSALPFIPFLPPSLFSLFSLPPEINPYVQVAVQDAFGKRQGQV